MSVRTLAMRLMILALTLESVLWPKAGSYEDDERPMRARKRSSDRMAMALMSKTETGARQVSAGKHDEVGVWGGDAAAP